MKNPLRYYVMEGLFILFYTSDPDNPGKVFAKFINCPSINDKLTVCDADGRRQLVVTSPAGDQTAYIVNGNFFLDYGILCENAEAIDEKIAEWKMEYKSNIKEFDKIRDGLEYA